jgi:L-threonylcarbamoyladenylate synthase
MSESEIQKAVQILRAGGLVAFPTETVYGLGADATNPAAVAKIFAAKGRPATNPLIAHVGDEATAKRYALDWPTAASKLVDAFWPGPLTMVVKKTPDICDAVTAGRATVGLRMPLHHLALDLLRAFGKPVAAPSANRSNRVSPTTAQHVREELGTLVDLIIDGGPCDVGIESTVLDLSAGIPAILRPGAVTREMIEEVIGKVAVFSGSIASAEPAMSPGQQEVHYAPRTPAVRFETSQRGLIHPEQNGMMVLGTGGFRQWEEIVAMPRDAAEYARRFYAVLRDLDARGLNTIYIEMPPDESQWAAVRDRIRRATREM